MSPLFRPENTEFVILSFEGADRYSQAGGLGVRVTQLGRALAKRGYTTHLLFIGDPSLPGLETSPDGHLLLHRWCQWISNYYPLGVYHGEEAKLNDFNNSVPPYIVNEIARPAVKKGRRLVVLAEEWHTAEALCQISDRLHASGLRQEAVLFWNANNTMGFEHLNWTRLGYVATLTTVSRYMKQILHTYGLDPLVIPNGIPADLLQPVDAEAVHTVRQTLVDGGRLALFKVGRFDPAKCWISAVEAAALLKKLGYPVIFLCRGGIEPYGYEVFANAVRSGLIVEHIKGQPHTWQEVLDLIRAAHPADLYNLCFFMTQEMLRPFYAAADAVLANSKHEPFGLVGLEAMAARGVVFTGPTGESYSIDGQGALALDTEDANEIVLELLNLAKHPERVEALRQAAISTATRFCWDKVLDVLLEKVDLAACRQGVTVLPDSEPPPAMSPVKEVVIYTVVHQPRRLRLPAQPIPLDASTEEMAECLFNDDLDQHYFQRVAERCYYPATRQFLNLVDQGLKLTIGFSLSFIRQAKLWDPQLLDLFCQLVRHPNVALAAVEPYHSFIQLWDLPCFAERMHHAMQQLRNLFGVDCQVADTTELMMSDGIYYALDQLGIKGAFFDGRPWVMEWRQPTFLYHHNHRPLRLLARHYALSDDVGFRFSDRNWECWPLLAPTYADWLAQAQGDLLVLGWDYETFGEHHHAEGGIFNFINWLVPEVQKRGLHFATALEALDRCREQAYDLPLPAFPTTWAGSGGIEFFLGNSAQQAVFQLMMFAYNKALLTGDAQMIDLALWLAQSDHLHLIQWYGRCGSEAEVSAYFTPQEWWELGPERIITEIQQVYKNFITALDTRLQTGSI